MKRHSHQFSIGHLCRLARVSRSGYHEWSCRPESFQSRANRVLLVSIKAMFQESRQTYGAVRIQKDLQGQGQPCGKNRVARLMRQNGLKSIYRKKYRPQTTQSDHSMIRADNIVNQDFSTVAKNQKWGGDISYVATAEGWLYVAVVLDFYSRKVIGLSTGENLRSELCCKALRQACLRREPPAELIHHSDRGVQYASEDYQNLLRRYRFRQSMSRRGNCYDNAMVESFFGTLKIECTDRRRYRTREEAKQDIENYIYTFYNPKRRHSSLDYKSPNDYEFINRLAA